MDLSFLWFSFGILSIPISLILCLICKKIREPDTNEGGGDVEMAAPASEQRDGNIVVLAGAGEATARVVGSGNTTDVGTYQGCCCGDDAGDGDGDGGGCGGCGD
ncbi:uncharacterized protein LOC125839216 [Solanum verrucosum]|uniref:uncharacterized protein LOC125839216 n=1 Tax=Solanum verrucosum TaxID=315347 RepID=UPI0020D0086A|nr:uncharacterized protein LOC125839216 [Solanum verrucosum]